MYLSQMLNIMFVMLFVKLLNVYAYIYFLPLTALTVVSNIQESQGLQVVKVIDTKF